MIVGDAADPPVQGPEVQQYIMSAKYKFKKLRNLDLNRFERLIRHT